jgi:hypothetical protein
VLEPSNGQDLRGIRAEGLVERAGDIAAHEADVLQRAVVELGEPHHVPAVPHRARKPFDLGEESQRGAAKTRPRLEVSG